MKTTKETLSFIFSFFLNKRQLFSQADVSTIKKDMAKRYRDEKGKDWITEDTNIDLRKSTKSFYNQQLEVGLFPEPKYFVGTGQLVFTTGSTQFVAPDVLNLIQQGANVINRVGLSIKIKRIEIRYTAQMVGCTGGGPVRIIVAFDQGPNGSLPSFFDLILGGTTLGPYNPTNANRMSYLADFWTERISSNEIISTSGTIIRNGCWYCTFKNVSTGTVADINTGALYISGGQNGFITGASMEVDYNYIIWFEDC